MPHSKQFMTAAIVAGLASITALAACDRLTAIRYAPLYGLVSFGPDADSPIEVVTLIARGSSIFIDANNDGVGQASEKFDSESPAVEFQSREGHTTRYRLTSLRLGLRAEMVSEALKQQVAVDVHLDSDGDQSHVRTGAFALSPDRELPGRIHFGGPLEIRLAADELQMMASPDARLQLRVSIESADSPNSRLAPTLLMPGQVVPMAEVVFPTGDTSEPVVKQFMLDGFC